MQLYFLIYEAFTLWSKLKQISRESKGAQKKQSKAELFQEAKFV